MSGTYGPCWTGCRPRELSPSRVLGPWFPGSAPWTPVRTGRWTGTCAGTGPSRPCLEQPLVLARGRSRSKPQGGQRGLCRTLPAWGASGDREGGPRGGSRAGGCLGVSLPASCRLRATHGPPQAGHPRAPEGHRGPGRRPGRSPGRLTSRCWDLLGSRAGVLCFFANENKRAHDSGIQTRQPTRQNKPWRGARRAGGRPFRRFWVLGPLGGGWLAPRHTVLREGAILSQRDAPREDSAGVPARLRPPSAPGHVHPSQREPTARAGPLGRRSNEGTWAEGCARQPPCASPDTRPRPWPGGTPLLARGPPRVQAP